jgi:hypothetical protein
MLTALLVRHADIDLPPFGGDPELNASGLRKRRVLRSWPICSLQGRPVRWCSLLVTATQFRR